MSDALRQRVAAALGPAARVEVDDVLTVPKVELHVHLEGSVRPATAIALAERHGEDPEDVLVLEAGSYPPRFRDFPHFVATFVAVSRQLRDPDDLRAVAADLARHQAEQGVLACEATFTAVTHVDNGIPPPAMWEALADGFADVPEVEVGLIVDAVRDAGVQHAHRTIALVETAPPGLVRGLGLAGIEGSHPERDFRSLRRAADDLDLGLAVHAGETGTADNVRAALDDLGADRIGHGIASVEDAALLDRLAADGTVLEVCPSSNVRLGVVPDLETHPIRALAAAGVAVTVHSDDPPFFATTLTEELAHACRLLDLDRGGLAALQRRAAEAAFLPAARRAELVAAVDGWAAA